MPALLLKPVEKKTLKKEFSNDEILEYGKFKSQPGQKISIQQKKTEDKSGEFSIESSSLDEEALKDLSSKAGIQKAYEVPKI
jgi:hypothetical protein